MQGNHQQIDFGSKPFDKKALLAHCKHHEYLPLRQCSGSGTRHRFLCVEHVVDERLFRQVTLPNIFAQFSRKYLGEIYMVFSTNNRPRALQRRLQSLSKKPTISGEKKSPRFSECT